MGMSRAEIDQWKRDNPNEVLLQGRLNRALTSADTPYIISGVIPKGAVVGELSKMWQRDITFKGDCKNGTWATVDGREGLVLIDLWVRLPKDSIDWMSDEQLALDIAREIAECKSILSVKQVLDVLLHIKGSQKTYTAKELCGIIDEFAIGGGDPDCIPRTYGIRKKIKDLYAEAFIASR